jgi:putative FmdB family regulatory protein
MPTYEYECVKCSKQFETVQSMNDPSYKVCPKELCRMKRWGKGKVKRLLSSGAGIIFKGSGFYITDYRSENYKQAAKKDGEASTSAAKEKSSSPTKAETTEKKKSPKPKSDS